MTQINRRSFIGGAALASAAFAVPNILVAAPERKFLWANLLHLGMNMWLKKDETLRCEDAVWAEYVTRSRDVGFNMIVIDLGEGVVYPSHPELAIKGSWTPAKLRAELAKLRHMGLEPIPKLNFSACHDLWLGPYGRMVSSPKYYQVVADVIKDVCEMFDRPRFFHIGMDEETYVVQRNYDYVVCRQGDLWFKDLDFYRREVEKHGARAMMWGDQAWSYPEFLEKASKTIVQNNWYYWKDIPELAAKTLLPRPKDEVKPVDAVPEEGHLCQLRAFRELDAAGFDQIPCATNFYETVNMEQLVAYCDKNIAPERLLGYFFASWKDTTSNEKQRRKWDEFYTLAAKTIKAHG